MMQTRSGRGVQQDEVWGAADLLVAEGLRPTIERVRQKIGRGSPNTVSPMLEAWFATLGARLGVSHSEKRAAEGEWPAPVQQAMTQLWEVALQSAHERAEQVFLQRQQALAAEKTDLQTRESDLAQRELALKTQQAASQEILAVTRGQVVDLSTRLAQSQTAFTRLEQTSQALQLRLTESDQQRQADQRRSNQEATRHAEERRQFEERATLNERRLMTELDRERQETKRLKSALKDVEQGIERLQLQHQADKEILATALHNAETALKSEHQSVVVAQDRAAELRSLLDEQRIAHATAMSQFSQRMTQTTLKAPIRSGAGKRLGLGASSLNRRKLKSL